MWVRGLKLVVAIHLNYEVVVAPHVGAWIETCCYESREYGAPVAPHVGAWIETSVETF